MNRIFLRLTHVVILLCVLLGGCSRESRKLKERPDDIITTKACPTLYNSIMEQFPEYRNNEANQALLFDEDAEKHIVILKETAVYVSFISEGAGYSNTFGWYSYSASNPPTNASQIEKHILFPNVSEKILKQGDMLQINDAKFPAGTVIGFFLIAGGWEGGSINYEKPTLYTTYGLNPNGQQQHILFKQKDCGDVVLAFEDRLLSEGSDSDFNDIIFTVSDNSENLEVTTLDLSKVVRM